MHRPLPAKALVLVSLQSAVMLLVLPLLLLLLQLLTQLLEESPGVQDLTQVQLVQLRC